MQSKTRLTLVFVQVTNCLMAELNRKKAQTPLTNQTREKLTQLENEKI